MIRVLVTVDRNAYCQGSLGRPAHIEIEEVHFANLPTAVAYARTLRACLGTQSVLFLDEIGTHISEPDFL